MLKKKVIVAVGGSSGAIYAKVLFDKLMMLEEQIEAVGIVMSDNAKHNWTLELGDAKYRDYPFDFYGKMDFRAPFASGLSSTPISSPLPRTSFTCGLGISASCSIK